MSIKPDLMTPIITFTPDLRPSTSSSTATLQSATTGDTPDFSFLFTNMSSSPTVQTNSLNKTLTVSPDDIFSTNWNSITTDQLTFPITKMSNDSSSPSATDFAFEPPSAKLSNSGIFNSTISPTNPSNQVNHYYGMPYSAYSNGSSFSSTSGSIGGASFSSAEALPAISRDFTRPAPSETRRPATAGGALQSRSGFGGFISGNDEKKDVILEDGGNTNGLWMNPFDSSDGSNKQVNNQSENSPVDPRFIPNNRRASEGQSSGSMLPPAWPTNTTSMETSVSPVYPPLGSAPPTMTNFNIYQNTIPPNIRSNGYNNSQQILRPQTSDGLPSFGGNPMLPSARSVVGSVDGFNPMSGGTLGTPAQIRGSFTSDFRERMNGRNADGELTFVALGGPAPKKRPRRRYDEIERLYLCGWNGCEKSYGTLNHLNAHVAMQKHGEKRLPSEFKDMRKAWRKKKREQVANAASGGNSSQYGGQQNGWRSSISSESDFDRRDSSASMLSSSSSRFPGTTPSVYSYDSRPTTADSAISNSGPSGHADGRFNNFSMTSSSQPTTSYGFNNNMNSIANLRRSSVPQHIPMPTQSIVGFRQNEDGPTPTQQNPFPIQHHHQHGNNGMIQPQMLHHHQQPQQQQQQQQYHNHQGLRPISQGGMPLSSDQGFPFQTLTQPMSVGAGQQYGQFAFQR